jgi:hypothetical protein
MPRLLYRINNAAEYAWLESNKHITMLHHTLTFAMTLAVVCANYDALFAFPQRAHAEWVDGRSEWAAIYVHSLLWLINTFLSISNILLRNTRHYYPTLLATAWFRNVFTVVLQSLYANWVLPAGTVVVFGADGGYAVLGFTFLCAFYPLKPKHRACVLLAKNAQMWLPQGGVKVSWGAFWGVLDVRIGDMLFAAILVFGLAGGGLRKVKKM